MHEMQLAARPAAQAGAQVLYQAVHRNIARAKRPTGKLASAIYQAYATKEQTSARAVYDVSWNPRKAPHGYLVEYGHMQRHQVTHDARGRFVTHRDRPLTAPVYIPGLAFMRGARSAMPAALNAMRKRYLAELAERGAIASNGSAR